MRCPAWLFSLLLGIVAICTAGERPAKQNSTQVGITTRFLNVNRLGIQITDRGNLLNYLDDSVLGVGWDYGDIIPQPVVYDHGPWIVGKVGGPPAMSVSYFRPSFVPGPIIDGRPGLDVRPQDSVRYHPYKLNQGSGPHDSDYVAWPGDLGAPTAPAGHPILLGDELIWAVFNGADTTAYPSSVVRRPFVHLPVTVHQAVYAHEGLTTDTSLLANTALIEWTFINNSQSIIESCYVGLWTDIDVGSASWNPFGVDTLLQMGYCWDSSAPDSLFAPRAVGYPLLFGPVIESPDSEAVFLGKSLSGYRNLPLSSFWGIRSDVDGPPAGPRNINEAWNLARGYDNAGNVIIDTVSMLPTKFPWSGDPVTGTGWVYNWHTGGEAGFMQFTGPFTFAPGDTQWVMFALIVTGGRDMPDGVLALRSAAARLREMTYWEISKPRVLAAAPAVEDLPASPVLYQNYPNPFNPSTTIRYSIPRRASVRLSVFNMLGQQVAMLVEGEHEAGSYDVRFDAAGLASGVYFCRLVADGVVAVKKLVIAR